MNIAALGLMLAYTSITNNETADKVIISAAGAVYIVGWIMGVIFAIMLIIAPLKIWSWTKRTCGEAEAIRSLLRGMDADRKKIEKAKAQHLANIEKRLENIENAFYANDAQQVQE